MNVGTTKLYVCKRSQTFHLDLFYRIIIGNFPHREVGNDSLTCRTWQPFSSFMSLSRKIPHTRAFWNLYNCLNKFLWKRFSHLLLSRILPSGNFWPFSTTWRVKRISMKLCNIVLYEFKHAKIRLWDLWSSQDKQQMTLFPPSLHLSLTLSCSLSSLSQKQVRDH